MCKDGWTQYENSCYKLLTGEFSQDSYQSICQAEGGDLASVHSVEENNVLASLLREKPRALFTWIGGYDCRKPSHGGSCKWLDGSDWDWTNFQVESKEFIQLEYNYYLIIF